MTDMEVQCGTAILCTIVVMHQVIPPHSEKLMLAKTIRRCYVPLGLVEEENFLISIASCLSTLDGRGRITICCINPGTVVEHYTATKETDIQEEQNPEIGVGAETGQLPSHIRALWLGGRDRTYQ